MLCRNFNSLSVIALALEFFGKTYKYNGYISLRSGLFSLCYKLCTCLSGCLVLLGGSTLIIALSVRNVYAELLKLVKSVSKLGGVDYGRACALEARCLCHFAYNGNLLAVLERKYAVVVFEKLH